jgi:gas vesicle protein
MWLAIFISGMVGATVMLLVAPMSGEETRRILRETLADAQVKAGTAIGDAQAKARQLTDIGQRVIEEQKSSIERGAEEAKSVAFGP